MNLKEILSRKAEYPVRLIAKDRKAIMIRTEPEKIVLYEVGDECGIEVIDFSSGTLRIVNKEKGREQVFDVRYDEETWELDGNWEFKKEEGQVSIDDLFPLSQKKQLVSLGHPLVPEVGAAFIIKSIDLDHGQITCIEKKTGQEYLGFFNTDTCIIKGKWKVQ